MENGHVFTKLGDSTTDTKVEAMITDKLQRLIEEFPGVKADNLKLFTAAMAFGLELGLSGQVTKKGADSFVGYVSRLFDL